MNGATIGWTVVLIALVAGVLALAYQLMAARVELARRQTEGDALEAAKKAALEAQVQALEHRFAELAATTLAQKQQALVGMNQASVGALFEALKAKLEKYEREVAAVRNETKGSAVSMATNVAQLQQFALEARRFTSALIGGSKIQGNQGEQILTRILEQSGLQAGREYDVQVGTAADGGRPDVAFYDALNRHVVYLDAKMNIKDFIEAYNLPDDTVDHRRAKAAALKKHVTSIRTQIDGLAARRYAETIAPAREGYSNLPLVAMFCPFNAVLEAALTEDPTLMNYAFGKHIVLVTPTTLWGYLWLISYGWKRVETEKNYERIQALGGEVVEKVNALLADIENVGVALQKATQAYENLRKEAGDKGQKSVKRAAEALLACGATPRVSQRGAKN